MELNPGPFGRGHKEPILDVKNGGSSEHVNKVCTGVKSRDCIGSAREKRRRAFMATMDKTADAIAELMRMMEEVSIDVKDDQCSKIAAKSSLKMIGVHEMEPKDDANQVEKMTQAMEEEEIVNPEFLSVLEKVMRVAEARKRWATDGPPFDLSFDVGGKQVG